MTGAWRCAVAALLLLTGTPPAGAVPEPRKTGSPLRQIDDVQAKIAAGDLKGALRLLDHVVAELKKGGYPPKAIAAIRYMQAIAFIAAGRPVEANGATDTLITLVPDDPEMIVTLYTTSIELDAFAQAQHALGLIVKHFPDAVPTLDVVATNKLLRWLNQTRGETTVEAVRMQLGDHGFARDRPASHDSAALEAARLHLARGEQAEAAALVAQLSTSEAMTRALVDRRFESLWPVLEKAAGPHREQVDALATARAEAALARTPADPVAREEAIDAFIAAGRLGDADRIGRVAEVPATTLDADAAERAGWVVDRHANVLFKLGRYDDADKRAGELAGFDLQAHIWAIGPAINRMERLVAARRYDEATARMDGITAQAARFGNPYARQLVRRLRVCTLAGLRRDTGAATTELIAHAADSATATIDGLLCVGRIDEAAQRMIAMFGGTDRDRRSAIELMQPDDVFGGSADPPVWAASYARLRTRPDVLAAFAPVGRMLPDSLRPAAADGRQR